MTWVNYPLGSFNIVEVKAHMHIKKTLQEERQILHNKVRSRIHCENF